MSDRIPSDKMQSANSNRIYSLDILRFVAAMAVVVYHFAFRGAFGGYTGFSLPELGIWTKYGFLGVNLFFIISGFVIAWSAEKHSLERFVSARFLRLYPGYIIGVTVTFLLTLAIGGDVFQTSISQYFANLSFLPQLFEYEFMDGVYWSIVLELIFYAWIAALVASGLYRKALPEIIAIWLIIAMINEFILVNEALRLIFITSYAGLFAGGMLIYRWKIKGCFDIWDKLLLAIAIIFSALAESRRGAIWGGEFSNEFDPEALAFISIVLFGVFVGFLNWKIPTALGKKLSILGALSYPLYLIHQHVGYMLLELLNGTVDRWVLFVGITMVLVLASAVIARFAEPAGRRLMKPMVEKMLQLLGQVPVMNKVLKTSAV